MVFPGVRRPAAHPRIRPIVLFIEDDLTLLDLYAMLIEEELGVVKASLGETGYELALSERPDVIVLDLLLPDVDGFTLRERLRLNAATMGIPVVVITGNDRAYARAVGLGAQFSAVLLKPCPADRLMSAIRHALAP
ncbi:MAG TPA: response regulator [Vicinamibacterales bacterium]|nr:response regulator [Vicinamibacterales bacterium]